MVDPKKRATLGLLIFIAAEIMFFGGLLSSYWVLRSQVHPWPPIGQPRYPVQITALNTLILLVSGFAFWRAEQRLRNSSKEYLTWLSLAGLAGLTFLIIQGYEWFQLVQFGMTAVSNIYGGLFYLIVGSHAFHAIIGLGILVWILRKAFQGKYSASEYTGLSLGKTYWSFVVLLWPVIYVALYLI